MESGEESTRSTEEKVVKTFEDDINVAGQRSIKP